VNGKMTVSVAFSAGPIEVHCEDTTFEIP